MELAYLFIFVSAVAAVGIIYVNIAYRNRDKTEVAK